MVRAWYLDDSTEDQRLPHQKFPGEFIPLKKLYQLGVRYWRFDPVNYEEDPEFQKIRKELGFGHDDICNVSPATLPNYDEKIVMFYVEHFHAFDEIRFVLDGSGYFDARDKEDKWIRVEVVPGDLLAMPAGSCHRFTMDTKNYIKALRLFVGDPNAPHYHLPEDADLECRKAYLAKIAEVK